MDASISSQDFQSEQKTDRRINNLRELSRVSFLRSLPHILEVWGVTVLAIWISLFVLPPTSGVLGIAVYFLAIFIISTRQHAIAVLIHDGIHYRIAENKVLNDWATRILLGFPNFMLLSKWRFIHFHHHRLTYKEGDPDIAIFARYPLSKKKFKVLLLKDFFGKNVINNQKYFLDLPFGWKKFNIKFFGQKRSELYLKIRDMNAFYFYWIIVSCAGFGIGGFSFLAILAFYWILPYCTFTQVILRLRGSIEHGNVPDKEDTYQQTRTYVLNPVLAYLISPKNVNYHLEHHLYPTVPFYRLDLLHKALLKTEYKNHKPFIQSFADSLRSLVK